MIARIFNPRKYKLGIAGVFLLMLSACSIIPKSQPLSVYRLDVPASTNTAQTLPVIDASLKISTPYSSSFINSNRILVRTNTGEINAYQGARWTDVAPTMFRNYLIDYFRDNGQIQAVVNDSFSISSDFNLEIDMRRFESNYQDNQIYVDIDFDAILVNNKNHKTIGAKNFKAQKQSDGVDVVSVVKQFNASSQLVANDLLLWINDQISKVKTK